jgi:uncharacterized alkaline shock family protein YloU
MTEQQQDTQQRQSPLRTERGVTTIQDGVVSKVVGIAAQEIDGVRMGGGTSQAVGSIMSAAPGEGGGASESRGISVDVGEVEPAVDPTMSVEYGRTIHQRAEDVRRNVTRRVENLLGLGVTGVNIAVNEIFFPQEQQQER